MEFHPEMSHYHRDVERIQAKTNGAPNTLNEEHFSHGRKNIAVIRKRGMTL